MRSHNSALSFESLSSLIADPTGHGYFRVYYQNMKLKQHITIDNRLVLK